MKLKISIYFFILAFVLSLVLITVAAKTPKADTARRGCGGRIEIITGWELRDKEKTSKGQIACIKPVGKTMPQVDFHTTVNLGDRGENSALKMLDMFKQAFKKMGATVGAQKDVKLGGLDAEQISFVYKNKQNIQTKSEYTFATHWEQPLWLICTAPEAEFEKNRAAFNELAGKVSFYPLTEEQERWIKLEGKPLGEIKSPLGKAEDVAKIAAVGFAEDWTKDGKIDGIAIAIDFYAKDQKIGKVIGWHNTRIVVDVKLTRKDTKQIAYQGTHYGIDWQDFPVASDPPQSCWIPSDKIKGGFDPAKDMGKFIMEVAVKTEKQGTFTYKDEACPHVSGRSKKK